MRLLSIGFTLFVLLLTGASTPSANYTDEIHAWQQHRIEGLKKPDSWLTLVGLFWLKPGANTVGSADGNDFVLPKGSAPAHIGTLHLDAGKVTLTAPGREPKVLSYDELKPTVITANSVSFFVIKRGDQYAVRAKDRESPVLKNFAGLEFFPVNADLRFHAAFTPDDKKVPILNVLGETEMQESPGVVRFTYRGHEYSLRPVFEESAKGKTLFFLFADATNRVNTYQAGRMLNTALPENGKVDLDFNRSYNPPCTFTPYATCPLPPKENRLAFAVEAGEKRYSKGHAEPTGSVE